MPPETNPFESPVDAVVVESSVKCPECGSAMEPGSIRTGWFTWDDGSRPWWHIFFAGYEKLYKPRFLEITPPKIPSHLCRQCNMVVMDFQKLKR